MSSSLALYCLNFSIEKISMLHLSMLSFQFYLFFFLVMILLSTWRYSGQLKALKTFILTADNEGYADLRKDQPFFDNSWTREKWRDLIKTAVVSSRHMHLWYISLIVTVPKEQELNAVNSEYKKKKKKRNTTRAGKRLGLCMYERIWKKRVCLC